MDFLYKGSGQCSHDLYGLLWAARVWNPFSLGDELQQPTLQ